MAYNLSMQTLLYFSLKLLLHKGRTMQYCLLYCYGCICANNAMLATKHLHVDVDCCIDQFWYRETLQVDCCDCLNQTQPLYMLTLE